MHIALPASRPTPWPPIDFGVEILGRDAGKEVGEIDQFLRLFVWNLTPHPTHPQSPTDLGIDIFGIDVDRRTASTYFVGRNQLITARPSPHEFQPSR